MKNKSSSLYLASIFLVASMLACNLGAPAPRPDTDSQPTQDASSTEAPQAAATSNACDNPYMPIVVGATWNYTLTGSTPDTYVHSILSVSADGFTEQDVFGTGVTRQGNWKCENGNLIALSPESGGSASVETEGVSADFQTTSLEGITMPASINPGDNWSQSMKLEGTQTINGESIPASNEFTTACTAVGTESVTVPAGTFDAMHFDCQTTMLITITFNGSPIETNLDLASSNWYAPKVGLIKTITIGSGLETTVELTSYSIP